MAQAPRPIESTSAAVFVVASATIVAALGFEHFGGYAACPLCLQERYAYYFAVPAALAAWFASRMQRQDVARVLLALVAVAFLINAGVGVYHAGVEWKWWPGPDTCAGGTAIERGAGGLAEQIENARVIRCDEAPWHFLGLSFAGWNAVISAFLAAIAAFGATRQS
jgi:disulfide bond formation protein DsbB